jgi:hypothetical protein
MADLLERAEARVEARIGELTKTRDRIRAAQADRRAASTASPDGPFDRPGLTLTPG